MGTSTGRILAEPGCYTAPVDDDPEEPPPIELVIDGVLDLHTFKPQDAAELVQDYLDECRRRGILEIRIIHGKGKGTLRRTVQAALARRDDVLEHRPLSRLHCQPIVNMQWS